MQAVCQPDGSLYSVPVAKFTSLIRVLVGANMNPKMTVGFCVAFIAELNRN